MTERADAVAGTATAAATDEADEWDARLGWAFGLTAEDPAELAAALDSLTDARANVRAALGRFNEL
ncbi:hypothetical protein [Streptomyces sp. NBC_00887]|uniref:hypothetical protein n=1 Tax=Streptomyces sp. NBC_00887 TaxID=2975859 RepID=UPI00386D58AE|nr:hypothetical protein OG844_34630 [Streptomyces sp. NBC_00887]